MSKWRNFLGGDEEPVEEVLAEEHGDIEEEEPKEEVAAAPSFMTGDQVQQMLDRQAEQMGAHFGTLVSGLQDSLAPKEAGQTVAMPSDDEMQKALDDGDSKAFLKLQKQKDIAMATIYDQRLVAQEAAANERLMSLQERVVETAVPQEYKKEVDGMMNELGIDRNLRSNPKVLEFLTLAAKGKNADAKEAAAVEAAKRQTNLEPTGDVASNGRAVGGHQSVESVFSPDAKQALAQAGHDEEKLAKQMGYDSWEDYEKATTNLYAAPGIMQNHGHKWMKKK